MSSNESSPSVIEALKTNPATENTEVKTPNNTTTNASQGVATLDPAKLPANVTVGKTVEPPKNQPKKPKTDTKPEADKLSEQKKKKEEDDRIAKQNMQQQAAAAEQERIRIAEENRKKIQIQADKTVGLRYLKTALANLGAEEYNSAKDALSNAYNLTTLSASTKKYISTALANIRDEEYGDAKKAVNQALSTIN